MVAPPQRTTTRARWALETLKRPVAAKWLTDHDLYPGGYDYWDGAWRSGYTNSTHWAPLKAEADEGRDRD